MKSVLWVMLGIVLAFGVEKGVLERWGSKRETTSFVEEISVAQVGIRYSGLEEVESASSALQQVGIYSSAFFGKIMVIDGALMTTERDERHYHEMIAHVPLALLPAASRVLIVGGGDGGTLTQVLAHPNVQAATLVEIDPNVVDLASRHMPSLAAGFADPRATVVYADGALWAKAYDGIRYDVVILDTTDFGAAEPLFTDAFYTSLIENVLRKDTPALVVSNVESPAWDLPTVAAVAVQMRSLFPANALFLSSIPTYSSGSYAFSIASTSPILDPADVESIDWPAWEAKGIATDYYSPAIHRAAFTLPPYVLNALSPS